MSGVPIRSENGDRNPKDVKLLRANSGNSNDVKLPRPIVFWSENEKDAFRRNRVVQTRCRMVLDEIDSQRKTSTRAIRYEAHKFRQKNEKYLSSARTDYSQSYRDNSFCRPADWIPRNNRLTWENNVISEEPDEKEQLPKIPGIITQARKLVRFSVDEAEYSDSSVERMLQEKKTKARRPASERSRPSGTEFDPKYLITRSLSAVCLRDLGDNKLLKRRKSAVASFQEKGTRENIDVTAIWPLSRADTFFVKSKAAYQLRQDLKRQALLRQQSSGQKTATISDYLNVERNKYIQSSEKIMEYIKRMDTEKLFEPLIINKWTAVDIEKNLKRL